MSGCEFVGSMADQVFACRHCDAFPEDCAEGACCCEGRESFVTRPHPDDLANLRAMDHGIYRKVLRRVGDSECAYDGEPLISGMPAVVRDEAGREYCDQGCADSYAEEWHEARQATAQATVTEARGAWDL